MSGHLWVKQCWNRIELGWRPALQLQVLQNFPSFYPTRAQLVKVFLKLTGTLAMAEKKFLGCSWALLWVPTMTIGPGSREVEKLFNGLVYDRKI